MYAGTRLSAFWPHIFASRSSRELIFGASNLEPIGFFLLVRKAEKVL